MQGKRVCRTHGGASTGPKTDAGKAKCAEVTAVRRPPHKKAGVHTGGVRKIGLLRFDGGALNARI